jgi:hypothetical protein
LIFLNFPEDIQIRIAKLGQDIQEMELQILVAVLLIKLPVLVHLLKKKQKKKKKFGKIPTIGFII